MNDKQLQDYLWDPTATASPDVQQIEARLGMLRFDPSSRSLELSALNTSLAPQAQVASAWRRRALVLAAAAALVLASGVGVWQWRWAWPDGRAWTLRTASTESPLSVGSPVVVPEGQNAITNVARIGTMRIAGGTEFALRSTDSRRHRLSMREGRVRVRVWAPPSSVSITTPAGEVIDMGCEFVLSVDGDVSRVQVVSGWVQLDNAYDEMLIPAGASSEMTVGRGPGVPVFDDADERFRASLRRIELGAGPVDLAAVIESARVRDVYTLLVLADHHGTVAEPLLRRAAELSTPPAGVTIGRILRGDRNALWAWADAQPLPALKSGWWKNWRDAFPFWLRD